MRDQIVAWLRGNLNELFVAVGVLCATVALWTEIGRLALIVPGIVLLWIGLPVRRWFIERPMFDEPRRKRNGSV